MRILVTGAGGFIGHHLVKRLRAEGHWVRGIDIKRPEFEASDANEFLEMDLRDRINCYQAMKYTNGVFDRVYNLAADMGGIGFISGNHSRVIHNNLLINIHMLDQAILQQVGRYFYSSSACVYNTNKQCYEDSTPLKEEDAYPADPEEGYGWEKLTTEKMCKYYLEDHKLQTRVARFHNIYGPLGTWQGGREKAPAALCRKIAQAIALKQPYIEIWGDGRQTRSFCYIDDCVEGIIRLTESDHTEPLNIGSDAMVTINELAELVMNAAGKKLEIRHIDGPQGVRGRNSDNTRCQQVLGWVPEIPLGHGLAKTYHWIAPLAVASLKGTTV